MESKKPNDSFVIMNEIVLPNDTNTFGNLMGGRLMYWMDIAGAMAATQHSNSPCMTVSVDNISFKNPIKLGNIVHIEAKITRAFNTSMEIRIQVWGQDNLKQYKYESNDAYFTFVALDSNNHPRRISSVVPETKQEIADYNAALRRRQLRLVLAGKMSPQDADELKALFLPTKEI